MNLNEVITLGTACIFVYVECEYLVFLAQEKKERKLFLQNIVCLKGNTEISKLLCISKFFINVILRI